MSKEKLLELARKIKENDLVLGDDDVELTDDVLARSQSITSSPELLAIMQDDNLVEPKKAFTIRLKKSTIKALQTMGTGYQTKVSKMLDKIAEDLKKQSKHS
jgi:uncharacterized protein (DUF4415 family)